MLRHARGKCLIDLTQMLSGWCAKSNGRASNASKNGTRAATAETDSLIRTFMIPSLSTASDDKPAEKVQRLEALFATCGAGIN